MRATDWDCVIPAGGSSRRMGFPKQLLSLEGIPLLATAIARAAPNCARCIVVTGAEWDRVRRVIPEGDGVVEVYNPDHEEGMITSIMAGARRVKTPWFFVVPADMPRLPAVAFARLAEAATRGDAAVGGDTGPGGDVAATDDTTGDDNADRAAAVDETAAGPGARAVLPVAYFPVMGGRRGHPVLVSSRVIPELLSHGGENPSMGAFLRRYPVGEVQIDDEGIFVDVDTPEDFAAISHPRADG